MSAIVDKAKQEVLTTRRAMFGETITLINGAFALVAALAWNEAVKSLIEKYFKAGEAVSSRFIYAVIITLLVVLITTKLSKFKGKFSKEE